MAKTYITNLFTFIGAKPCTEWLYGLVATDEKGFIFTGAGISENDLYRCDIFRKRKPQSLETSIPGSFIVGNVRKGSVKRVASAVGAGAMAVSPFALFSGGIADSRVGGINEDQLFNRLRNLLECLSNNLWFKSAFGRFRVQGYKAQGKNSDLKL